MGPDCEERPENEVDGRAPARIHVRIAFVAILVVALLTFLMPREWPPPPRRRIARAQEEVHCIEVACMAILKDAGEQDFFGLFTDVDALREAHGSEQRMWGEVVYDLLQNGKNAKCDLKPEVRERLGASYLTEVSKDPWGNLYRISPGPWTHNSGEPIPFRCFRPGTGNIDEGDWTPYVYDAAAKSKLDDASPGNPDPDHQPGFPAPLDMSFYIHSLGPNMLDDQNWSEAQDSVYEGGGDDINNWDNERGWYAFTGG